MKIIHIILCLLQLFCLFYCSNINEIKSKTQITPNQNQLELYQSKFLSTTRSLSEGSPSGSVHSEHGSTRYGIDDPEFYIFILISLFLSGVAGICSGLTVGYLSIDELSLQIKMKTGTAEEKKAAAKIMPLIQKHHVLLSTLLIANALALESLPIFLEATLPASVAIIISTLLVVIFGEILPQALCTGPKQMKIAENMSGLMKFLMVIFGIFAYPLGSFLDWLLGKHGAKRFPKRDLKALIELHKVTKKVHMKKNETDVPDSHMPKKSHHDAHSHNLSQNSGFSEEEVEMITGTIDLRERKVTKIMIDIEKVFMLNKKEKFTNELIKKIASKGYSRIPVFEKNKNLKIIGCLKSKTLLDSTEKILNRSVMEYSSLQPPLLVSKDTNLFELLMIFQDKNVSIGFVTNEIRKIKKDQFSQDEMFYSRKNLVVDSHVNDSEILGIVSLKDIFEEILNKELKDDDIHKSLPQQQPAKRVFQKISDNPVNPDIQLKNLKTIPEEIKEGK